MYRDQLFCVFAPAMRRPLHEIEGLVADSEQDLGRMLKAVDNIHYATLFVLPPSPRRSRSDTMPEVVVVLELVVDEGTRVDDLLRRLVDVGLDTLWPLYGPYCPVAQQSPPTARACALTAFLIAHAVAADGGFVGTRDFTVEQVEKEAALYVELRKEAAVLAPEGLERATLAARLSSVPAIDPMRPRLDRQCQMARLRDGLFPWARDPVTPNAWCDPSLGIARRIARIALESLHHGWMPVLVVLGALLSAIIGALVFATSLLIAPADRVWASLAVGGASPELVRGTLIALWATAIGLMLIGVGLWLRQFASRLVIAMAIPLVALAILLTIAVFIQLLVTLGSDWAGVAYAYAAVLPVVGVLVSWAMVWLVSAVVLGSIMAASVIGATRLVRPYQRTSTIVSVGLGLFVVGVVLANVALYVLPHVIALLGPAGVQFAATSLLWRLDLLLFVLLIVPAAASHSILRFVVGLAFLHVVLYGILSWREWFEPKGCAEEAEAVLALDAVVVLVPIFATIVVMLYAVLARIVTARFGFDRERGTTVGLPDQHEDPVPRAHQIHESVVASEARLFNRCNHMISLTEIRWPLIWHRFTTGLALKTVGRLADTLFVDGLLGQATGIHFAHWYLIDDGRRLLFLSNYDGDFSGYLDEFIHGASVGVNLIWRGSHLVPRDAAGSGQPGVRHARAFPPVSRAVLGGCAHEQWFKAYVRDSMLPHLYRFEAYDHSLSNIFSARRLRNARCAVRDPIQDDRIMRALER